MTTQSRSPLSYLTPCRFRPNYVEGRHTILPYCHRLHMATYGAVWLSSQRLRRYSIHFAIISGHPMWWRQVTVSQLITGYTWIPQRRVTSTKNSTFRLMAVTVCTRYEPVMASWTSGRCSNQMSMIGVPYTACYN